MTWRKKRRSKKVVKPNITTGYAHKLTEDQHAFCQAMFQGVEGTEWDAMYYDYQYKDLHQAVESLESGEHKKAKVLWAMKEAKGKGEIFKDAGHGKEIKTRAQFRLDLWAIHLTGTE